MAALSDYLETNLVNHVLRGTAFTAPASTWVALFTADDGLEAGTITSEVSGGSYARVEVGTGGWSAPTDGVTDNSADVDFGTATANWGTVTHVAIMDASTAGNVLWHGALTTSKTVNNGDPFKFPAGDLTLSLA